MESIPAADRTSALEALVRRIVREELRPLHEALTAMLGPDPGPKLDPRRRYHLSVACEYLGLSESTLRSRARERRLQIVYDGRTPYVFGAEILRYERDEARARKKRRPA